MKLINNKYLEAVPSGGSCSPLFPKQKTRKTKRLLRTVAYISISLHGVPIKETNHHPAYLSMLLRTALNATYPPKSASKKTFQVWCLSLRGDALIVLLRTLVRTCRCVPGKGSLGVYLGNINIASHVIRRIIVFILIVV